jgi:hypothetical protein
MHLEKNLPFDEILVEIYSTEEVKCRTLQHPVSQREEFRVVPVILLVFFVSDNPTRVDHKLVMHRHIRFLKSIWRHYQILRPIFEIFNIQVFILLFLTHNKLDRILQTVPGEKRDGVVTGFDLELLPILVRILADHAVLVVAVGVLGAQPVGLQDAVGVHGREDALTADAGVRGFVQRLGGLLHYGLLEVDFGFERRQFGTRAHFVHGTAQFEFVQVGGGLEFVEFRISASFSWDCWLVIF